MKKSEKLASLTNMLVAAAAVVVFSLSLVGCTNQEEDTLSRAAPKPTPTPGSYFYGEEMINDSTKCDSVVKPDGTVEKAYAKFYCKARAHREVITENLNNPNAEETFTTLSPRFIESRKEGNFLIQCYGASPRKGIEVGPTGETVPYDTYEEIVTYIPESGESHEFTSKGWEISNVSDVFKAAPISSKDGYTELDYKNTIRATYTGVSSSKVFSLEETIAFFAPGIVPVPELIDHYEGVGERNDYPSYTFVTLEKIAVYTNGNRETVGKYSANIPIEVKPLTNWVLNVDVLGTYEANAFAGTQTGKTGKTAEKFFSYSQFSYRYSNVVAGQENALSISVPNEITFDDGELKYSFKDTELNVEKGAEATTKRDNNVYGYTCEANVTFGASQSVTLPGTINVKPSITKYGVVNASRVDYPTYTYVYLEKVAYYSDGTEKNLGGFSATLPIEVNPLTDWTLYEDVYGVYTSGAFSGTQTGKVARTAEKFFSFNQYSYRYANSVRSKENALAVSVPNDIVFNDGDVKHSFSNTKLNVENLADNVKLVEADKNQSTYAYTCVANVVFGASQEVELPGTIIIDNKSHDHGKVTGVNFTSTLTENRGFYYSVAVIVFEDGYRKIGMADNSAMNFDFTMASTTDGVNSTVYTDNQWVPSIAVDEKSDGCMVWYDESYSAKRTYDCLTANRNRWNNGHNTVVDVRRDYKISSDGYSVTLYLNGLAGQKLDF